MCANVQIKCSNFKRCFNLSEKYLIFHFTSEKQICCMATELWCKHNIHPRWNGWCCSVSPLILFLFGQPSTSLSVCMSGRHWANLQDVQCVCQMECEVFVFLRLESDELGWDYVFWFLVRLYILHFAFFFFFCYPRGFLFPLLHVWYNSVALKFIFIQIYIFFVSFFPLVLMLTHEYAVLRWCILDG